MDLTVVRLWEKAYLLTERNAVRNRTWKYGLVLFKRCGASLAHTGGWQPCKGNCSVLLGVTSVRFTGNRSKQRKNNASVKTETIVSVKHFKKCMCKIKKDKRSFCFFII